MISWDYSNPRKHVNTNFFPSRSPILCILLLYKSEIFPYNRDVKLLWLGRLVRDSLRSNGPF